MIFRNQNRRLLSNQVAYSGEKVVIELPSGLEGVTPADCTVAIVAPSREVVAASTDGFDASWRAVVDTATVPMEGVFRGKLANTALTFALVVFDGGGTPVIGGQITIVASPFPSELLPLDVHVIDPIVRTSDILDLFVAGENVSIRQVNGKVEITATGGGSGTGVDPAAATALKNAVNNATTIKALREALTSFADNLVPTTRRIR